MSEESDNSVQNNETQEHDKEDPVTVEEINGVHFSILMIIKKYQDIIF